MFCFALGLLIAGLVAGCADRVRESAVAGALEPMLEAPPDPAPSEEIWTAVQDFYRRRDGAPAWFDGGSASEALRLLAQAEEHGFHPSDYGLLELHHARDAIGRADEEGEEIDLHQQAEQLAQFDVRLTTALLTLGRDVSIGRTKPGRLDSRWTHRREAPDLAATLADGASSSVAGWLEAIRPPHEQYAALQRAMADMLAEQEDGRPPDLANRIEQVSLNLERWRWMPDDLGSRHVFVNIPAYDLQVKEQGRTLLQMSVVVGEEKNRTPVFSGEIRTVVFSPYWNIPRSIAIGETIPSVIKDPNYLTRNRIEVLRRVDSGSERVDPAEIDWSDREAVRGLLLRQRPGSGNSLGGVKFLFPNPFSVYLHDTPADELFERENRALSHGCIRLSRPFELATYVLRDDAAWDAARIRRAMSAGVERHVRLDAPLPVHIVYFTAAVGEAGTLEMYPDVYGYDGRQRRHGR